ncbi:MFS transporter [Microbispora triticiradicis]|uniref:MFS transporter n=1 Tax=Microbispora triticiradicis TaxID=2200763 RepID=UPI001AD7457A|nr:MFS transporter [Microbispora triticiradicis]MBO4271855.1 MFS transporter [Microbispora triticiradicis]
MTTTSHTVTAPERPARRELTAATVGGVVEFFDWTLYGVLAPYFAQQIFPGGDSLTKLLAAYMGFAVGFFARPVGSVIMGRIADTRGRRFTMTLSVAVIAIGSLLIGLAPTYATAGVTGAVLIVVVRFAMGLSVAGELASTAAFVTETAPRSRRFLYSAVSYGGSALGQLLSFAVLSILLIAFGKEGLENGAWRYGFLLGAVLGLVALWIRRSVEEPEEFVRTRASQERPKVGPLLRAALRTLLTLFFVTVGSTMSVYFGTLYLPQFAIGAGVVSASAGPVLIMVAVLVQFIAMVVFGKISDRLGPLTLTRIGLLYLAVATVPLMSALLSGAVPFLLAACLYVLGVAPALAVLNVLGGRLFPVHVRATAIGVSTSLAVASFGGTFPLVAEAMAGSGHQDWVGWYAAAGAAVSLVASLFIRRSDFRDDER